MEPSKPPSRTSTPNPEHSGTSDGTDTTVAPSQLPNLTGFHSRWSVRYLPSLLSQIQGTTTSDRSEPPAQSLGSRQSKEAMSFDSEDELSALLSNLDISEQKEDKETDAFFRPIPRPEYLRQFSAPGKMFSSATEEAPETNILHDRVVRKNRKRKRLDRPDTTDQPFVLLPKKQQPNKKHHPNTESASAHAGDIESLYDSSARPADSPQQFHSLSFDMKLCEEKNSDSDI